MRNVNSNKHAQKRAEIIQAAVKCFEEWGLVKTSTAKICAAAKISPGHLYHYFSSKDEILAAIADQVFATAVDYFRQHDGQLSKFDVVMQFFTDRVFQDVKGHRSVLMDLISQSNHDESTRNILQKYTQSLQQLLVETLTEGQQAGEIRVDIYPDTTALFIISLIDAAKVLPVRINDDTELTAARETLVTALKHHLKLAV